MKCPFRTVRKVRLLEASVYEEEMEFAKCLEYECPYYGKRIMRHRAEGGFEKVIEPGCRRVNDGTA